MSKRALTSVAVTLVFAAGAVYAWYVATMDGSELLFDSGWWLVFAAPLVGVFAAGFTKRQDPRIEGDKVLRHDGAAILEHWTHGIGTMMLLVSGIALGLLFIPRLVGRGTWTWAMMNIHFVFVLLFLFGTFYYGANTLLSAHRFKEHLPTGNFWDYTKNHYGHLLGIKSCTMPPEDKYFESEKIAYIVALGSTVAIILTGLVKALAHVVDLPAGLMGATTLIHDIATVAMLAFFLAHVLFAAILPMGWPVLKSMFTGYVSVEQVKKEHAGWYKRLTSGDAPE
ncbi:MAG: cytochrome b/b6 domain-containing protein [Actinomycetota bacterium]